MRSRALVHTFGSVLLFVSPAFAADPVVVRTGGPGCSPPPCATPWAPSTVPGAPAPGMQQPGQQPGAAQAPAAQAPQTDAFAQAPPTGGEAAQSAVPNMVGDLGIYGVAPRVSSQSSPTFTPIRFAPSPSFSSSTFASSTTFLSSSSSRSPSQSFLASSVPVANFGSAKISDNESAAPVDRVFITYNYFDVDGFGGNSASINREVIGFEKTFLDGRGSFGIRAPWVQVGQNLGGTSDFGDLSLVFKYAAYMDREAGNVISGGLVVTVPTGPDIPLSPTSSVSASLIEPYIGYAFSFGRFYVQGFSEIIIPTDDALPTFVANDIGVGYRLEAIPIVPIFEVHANNGLNHQGASGTPIGFIDSVILTGGFHTLIGNSVLTLGVATPVTGPRLESIEAVVQFNWRF